MRHRLAPALALLLVLIPGLRAAEDTEPSDSQPAASSGTPDQALPEERAVVDGIPQPLHVSNLRQLHFKTPKVADLDHTELWYRSFADGSWSEWAKLGTDFPANDPVLWSPPEGIWQVYLNPVLTSGFKDQPPSGNQLAHPNLSTMFIIQRTPPKVELLGPAPKSNLRGHFTYQVKWAASSPYLRSAPITLLYSRDGQTWDVVAANIPNKGVFDWTTPIDMTRTGQLKVQAMDKAGNIGEAVNGDLLIDSVNPHGQVVGPPISNQLSTMLQFDLKDGGPSGLKWAQLWVSPDDGTSWTPSDWIRDTKQQLWKAPGDGTYRLAIVAYSNAGNQSPVPKGKANDQFSLIIDTTPPLVQLQSPIGIIPATAAGPNMQRAFKRGDRVQVPFVIKDANPKPNSAAIYLETAPGKWEELAAGQPLDQVYRFALPDVRTKTARIKVTAEDLAGNVGEATAPETFEIQTGIEVQDGGDSIGPFGK